MLSSFRRFIFLIILKVPIHNSMNRYFYFALGGAGGLAHQINVLHKNNSCVAFQCRFIFSNSCKLGLVRPILAKITFAFPLHKFHRVQLLNDFVFFQFSKGRRAKRALRPPLVLPLPLPCTLYKNNSYLCALLTKIKKTIDNCFFLC